jgi:hypothetical protein
VGSLDVVLPMNQLRQHVTHEASIGHFYPYKFIKVALTGVAGQKGDFSTQVAIDVNGLLKVRWLCLVATLSMPLKCSECHIERQIDKVSSAGLQLT